MDVSSSPSQSFIPPNCFVYLSISSLLAFIMSSLSPSLSCPSYAPLSIVLLTLPSLLSLLLSPLYCPSYSPLSIVLLTALPFSSLSYCLPSLLSFLLPSLSLVLLTALPFSCPSYLAIIAPWGTLGLLLAIETLSFNPRVSLREET